MSRPVIFVDLPATFPEKDKHKTPAAIGSIVVHIVLMAALILVPLLIPQSIERWQLLTLIAPLAPPPPPAPPIPAASVPKPIPPVVQTKIQIDPGVVVAPTEIPREIARIVDDVPEPVVSGIAGGVPGGAVSGILSGLLLANVRTAETVAPPPPPPPPPPSVAPAPQPAAPVRVGGIVKEPRVLKVVPPAYPSLAKKARITGTVVLEAVVTAEGTVQEIRVVSGHPLLVQAAIDCLKQWRYEPTYLNGEPVAVVLDAKVHFEMEHL